MNNLKYLSHHHLQPCLLTPLGMNILIMEAMNMQTLMCCGKL